MNFIPCDSLEIHAPKIRLRNAPERQLVHCPDNRCRKTHTWKIPLWSKFFPLPRFQQFPHVSHSLFQLGNVGIVKMPGAVDAVFTRLTSVYLFLFYQQKDRQQSFLHRLLPIVFDDKALSGVFILFILPAYLQLAPLPNRECCGLPMVNRYHGTLTPPRIAPSRPS